MTEQRHGPWPATPRPYSSHSGSWSASPPPGYSPPPGSWPESPPPAYSPHPGHYPMPVARPPSGLFPGMPPRPVYREPHPVSAAPVLSGLGATLLWFGLFGGLAHDLAGYAWWTIVAALTAWAVALVLTVLAARPGVEEVVALDVSPCSATAASRSGSRSPAGSACRSGWPSWAPNGLPRTTGPCGDCPGLTPMSATDRALTVAVRTWP